MGLDTTHNAFHGGYISFMQFRRGLLMLTDRIDIDDLIGYSGVIPVSAIKDRGIRRLIDQSDCDGEISPKDCKLIADDLTRYLTVMDPESELYNRSLQFRDGCLLAVSLNEPLKFQ